MYNLKINNKYKFKKYIYIYCLDISNMSEYTYNKTIP